MQGHMLNWLDYFILLVVIVSTLIGLLRGFIREAFSLATWIIAVWIGFTYSRLLAPYMKFTANEHIQLLVAFIILLALGLIIGGLLSYLIFQAVHRTGLGGTDRTLGMVFGFARGIVIITVLLVVAGISQHKDNIQMKNSVLAPSFTPLAEWLNQLIPDSIKKKFIKKDE
jgi:membrane protein required for colicin V production